MAEQLPLTLALDEQARFENFYPGPNGELVERLRGLAEGETGVLYLWGAPGSGRSHLLQAACHHCSVRGGASLCLDLSSPGEWAPELLDGLEGLDLVCLDESWRLAGKADWERALFHLYNRCRERGTPLVISGDAAPAHSAFQLPDLRSRLGWDWVYRLQPLSDADKAEALVYLAALRGLDLPKETAHYLLRRCPRDMATLRHLLHALDTASLASRRALTIPFVNAFLARNPRWQTQAGLFDAL